jgi:hypothetical protein
VKILRNSSDPLCLEIGGEELKIIDIKVTVAFSYEEDILVGSRKS